MIRERIAFRLDSEATYCQKFLTYCRKGVLLTGSLTSDFEISTSFEAFQFLQLNYGYMANMVLN